ncbi:MAG: hypothetical protein ABEJ60_05730 [Halodesulfurarchaeum sp.]
MIKRLLASLDPIAYRLFGRHTRNDRHDRERTLYAALAFEPGFETYLIGQYAVSWLVAALAGVGVAIGAARITASTELRWPVGPGFAADIRLIYVLGAGLLAGGCAKYVFRWLVRVGMNSLVRRRRTEIEHTLPGAVRFLQVTATGTTDPRRLLAGVADRKSIHGATAESFRSILRRQALTGSVESAIRREARDTPGRDSLAPFLRTFLERHRDGERSLREFLAAESRLLAVEDEQRHRREGGYLRAVVGLFVVLLVGPLVVGLGVLGAAIVLPAEASPIPRPLTPRLDGILTGLGSGSILLLGGGAALLAYLLRPSGHRWALPEPAQSPAAVLRTSPINPTNALLLLLPPVLIGAVWGIFRGIPMKTAILAGYVALAIPTGLIDVRRARRRSRLDRALPAFVHALAERLESGMPFRRAVSRISMEERFGPLDGPIRKLAVDVRLNHGPEGGRARALERFVGRIGTPFAGRTVGLAVGAIEAGADARTAVAHLQTETGRLRHADRARRARFPVVILVGWTVGLLIVAIVVAVNLMVLDTATPSGPVAGITVGALDGPTSRRPLFYVLTQATMLASGWFAGLSGRGVYEALLHSGVLLAVAWLGFRLAGLV